MELRIVGAGLFRTGTMSLKGALERLLGAPCYHMAKLVGRPEHVAEWRRYADGGTPDRGRLFGGTWRRWTSRRRRPGASWPR